MGVRTVYEFAEGSSGGRVEGRTRWKSGTVVDCGVGGERGELPGRGWSNRDAELTTSG